MFQINWVDGWLHWRRIVNAIIMIVIMMMMIIIVSHTPKYKQRKKKMLKETRKQSGPEKEN